MRTRAALAAIVLGTSCVISLAVAPSGAAVVGAPAQPVAPAGFMPKAARTPGAIDPRVTQANIHSTICVSGYTATVRPKASYTTALKKQQLASGYAYKGVMKTSYYEEDHLISLELGGAPSNVKNLWPEPYNGPYGAHTKDKIENKLHDMVCSGAISLRTAQQLEAKNWYAAYVQYVVNGG